VRLLSRRIIIRLLDDVKKKVQKNLRARSNRSTSCALCDDNTIDTHIDLDCHTINEVPSACVGMMVRRVVTRLRRACAHYIHARCNTCAVTIAMRFETPRPRTSQRLENRMDIGFSDHAYVSRACRAQRQARGAAASGPTGTSSFRHPCAEKINRSFAHRADATTRCARIDPAFALVRRKSDASAQRFVSATRVCVHASASIDTNSNRIRHARQASTHARIRLRLASLACRLDR